MSEGPNQDLEHLIARVALADRKAFDALYRQFSPRAFAICLRLLPDRQLAEDALQDSFVKIWRFAADFRAGDGLAGAWMSRIVRNQCLDMLRASRRQVSTVEIDDDRDADPQADDPAEAASAIGDPLRAAESREIGESLERCLRELRASQQRLVVASWQNGLSQSELAVATGLPLGTVKSLMRRALIRLRECMGAFR